MDILSGKVALVTGGGGAIGRAVSVCLARYGARVVVNDLGAAMVGGGGDASAADGTVAEIVGAGGEAIANFDSVSSWEGAQAMIGEAIDGFGRIDLVVNNAGIIRASPFAEMPVEDFEAVAQVHLFGSFYVSRAAAPHFVAQGSGSFVHMASSAGLIGARGMVGYAAGKLGVVGLSRSIAMELSNYGIRSNCVAPHAFSRMVFSGRTEDPAMVAALEKRRATNRPEQVAEFVAFLLSDKAAGISGQIFGARGNEVFLYDQPRPMRTIHTSDGWTPETLGHVLPAAWRNDFTPIEDTADVFAWDAI